MNICKNTSCYDSVFLILRNIDDKSMAYGGTSHLCYWVVDLMQPCKVHVGQNLIAIRVCAYIDSFSPDKSCCSIFVWVMCTVFITEFII